MPDVNLMVSMMKHIINDQKLGQVPRLKGSRV